MKFQKREIFSPKTEVLCTITRTARLLTVFLDLLSSPRFLVMSADPPPPQWAQTLISQVTQMQTQQLSLQAAVAQLQGGAPPTTLPSYPENVAAEAVAAILNDARLPPTLRPFAALLAFALPHILSDEDAAMAQAAFSALVSTLQRGAAVQPPDPGTPGGPAPSQAGRFLLQDGRQLYVSKKGRYYDTALPPPFPCRYCHGLHWNWQPCTGPAPARQYAYGYPPGPAMPAMPFAPFPNPLGGSPFPAQPLPVPQAGQPQHAH